MTWWDSGDQRSKVKVTSWWLRYVATKTFMSTLGRRSQFLLVFSDVRCYNYFMCDITELYVPQRMMSTIQGEPKKWNPTVYKQIVRKCVLLKLVLSDLSVTRDITQGSRRNVRFAFSLCVWSNGSFITSIVNDFVVSSKLISTRLTMFTSRFELFL